MATLDAGMDLHSGREADQSSSGNDSADGFAGTKSPQDTATHEPDTAGGSEAGWADAIAADATPSPRDAAIAETSSNTCISNTDCSPDDFCADGRCVSDVVHVATGYWHTCAIQKKGKTVCWGDNSSGQLGIGRVGGSSLVPAEVQGLPSAVALALGGGHSCALAKDGRVFCWGSNQVAQLGDNGMADRGSAAPVKAAAGVDFSGVSAIAAGSAHTCALASGGVHCWGSNDHNQLGQPSGTSTSRLPVLVSGSSGARMMVVGEQSSGYHEGGSFCGWGWNIAKQVADSMLVNVAVPTCTDITATHDLVMGTGHGCAILATGVTRCWGLVIGTDQLTIGPGPPGTIVEGQNFLGLVAGQAHSCGRLSDGRILCWGGNSWGSLGDGTTDSRTAPSKPVIEVDGSPVTGSMMRGLASGSSSGHTCAILADGSLRCWGWNERGQIGQGHPGGIAERAARVKW